MIELSGIGFEVAGRAVLDGVTLRVAPGELVVLGGPNGAGKSTLLRLALGLCPPVRGEVRIAGRALRSWARIELARTLAYVPQTPLGPLPFTVAEVVLMGRAPHAGRFALEREQDRAVVREALTLFELGPLAHRPLATLSGGERQRTALARAFAQCPRALVLDEPTNALDLRHRVALFRALRARCREHRLACLLASHDLGLAAQYADRIVLLADAKVLAEGPPEAVVRKEVLERAFGVGVDVARHPRTGRPYLLFGAEAVQD